MLRDSKIFFIGHEVHVSQHCSMDQRAINVARRSLAASLLCLPSPEGIRAEWPRLACHSIQEAAGTARQGLPRQENVTEAASSVRRQPGVKGGPCGAGAGGEEVPQPPRRQSADREQEQVAGGDPLALLPRQPGQLRWRCAFPLHPHTLQGADMQSDALRCSCSAWILDSRNICPDRPCLGLVGAAYTILGDA